MRVSPDKRGHGLLPDPGGQPLRVTHLSLGSPAQASAGHNMGWGSFSLKAELVGLETASSMLPPQWG